MQKYNKLTKMSKGSTRRPKEISDEEFKNAWDKIFNSPHKKKVEKNKRKEITKDKWQVTNLIKA